MKTHSVFIRADSPTPRLRGDAPKMVRRLKHCYTTAFSRVCQSPLSDPKAQSESGFRYAAAERILNPLVGKNMAVGPLFLKYAEFV
jgi:hypothetical protein